MAHKYLKAGELANLFAMMPPAMTVAVVPITDAFMGTMQPLRFRNELPNIWDRDGKECSILAHDARVEIYVFEDNSEDES